MPKAITVPPALNTADIGSDGVKVLIKEVRKVVDLMTQIGVTKAGIALTIEYKKAQYSQLFSLDKAVIAGSAGRILNSIGITDTEMPHFEDEIQKLVGKQLTVKKIGGKIYWYP